MQDELAVAGIFVRMFILQPTFQLADPAGLTKGLVSWVYSNAGHAWALPGAQMLLDFCAMCTAASRQTAMCNGNTDSSHLAAAIRSAHSLNVYVPAAWMADRPIHSIRLGRGAASLHCVTYMSLQAMPSKDHRWGRARGQTCTAQKASASCRRQCRP